ncbi:uncharacterized protein FIBRA_03284 [Fibroporia radiculosa]|uniref:Uncharacterized protein n=1 Tax=Fibroporia radiculosa TaxID=599839 RepID=J4I9I8_9APHY|nr:uncharacterized protein FIBRA_03284 [Fibroporia radiculosa]CCM01236.1 predicted protein [Fibroporia radiculosa]
MSEEYRIAVVTGAGQGIGRTIALRLADDGFDVAVNDLASNSDALASLVGELQMKRRRAIPIVADITEEANVEGMIAKVVQELGGLDVMVANAGIGGLLVPLTELPVKEWDRVVAVNLRGVMLCYKHAAEQMIKQGRGGRIIGASSQLGKQGQASASAYCATKFAVRGLTQSLGDLTCIMTLLVLTLMHFDTALELAEHKITVNAYAPGTVDTPMSRGFLGDEWFLNTRQRGEMNPSVFAEPTVIASIVSYLVKPETYFVTGQAINVNGGTLMD